MVINVVAYIRENKTGKVVEYNSPQPEEPNLCYYIWSDGNFSCDCNRSLFFSNNKVDSECGNEKYSVNVFNKDTMECIYREYGVGGL